MRLWVAAAICLALAASAEAQVTIDAGAMWLGSHPIGVTPAELRTNAPGATPPPFTLFTVDSRLASALAVEVRGGVEVGRGFSVEGSAAFARRRLSFSIAEDAEAPPQEFEGESVQHYEFGAGLTWQSPRLRTDRLRPFLSGGATYLRQLHQDRTLVESGQVFYAGGGARYWLWGRPGSARSFGVRGDLRFNVSRKAIDFEDKARTYPSLSLLLFLGL